jgi:tRNA(Ile)-lysidine synthase
MAESSYLHYHLFVREKVLRYIRERKLMRAGDRVAVAASGGADSVALLRVLLELCPELGIVLSVAHFNHGLRGQDSDADQAFAADLARQHELEFFSGHGDVRDHALINKLSLEAAARELRYSWLTLLAQSHKLNAIATGHTLDDQAETVLLKFLRGAGTRGLAGIYPEIAIGGEGTTGRRDGNVSSAKAEPFVKTDDMDAGPSAGSVQALKARTARTSLSSEMPASPLEHDDSAGLLGARIIRPSLAVTREEVEQYLTALGQEWREDESNLDHRFARNRIRHELLPLLEREYNPNILRALSDLAEVARGEEEYWQGLVERELEARQSRRTEVPRGPKPDNQIAGDGTAEAVPLQTSGVERGQSTESFGSLPTLKPELAGEIPSLPSAEADSFSGTNPLDAGLKAGTTRTAIFSLCGEAGPLPDSPSTRLNLDDFSTLPLALQRRLLKRLLESCKIPADFEHIEKLLRCALGEAPKAELPGGWLAVRRGKYLELQARPTRSVFCGYQYTLPVPGEIYIAELGLAVRLVPVPQAFAKEAGTPESLLSAELLGPELIVRNWRPGDRFCPLHSKSEEKLKRLFSERHIPAEQRQSWPVVLVGEQVVWVRGFPAARAFAWSGSGDAVTIEML